MSNTDTFYSPDAVATRLGLHVRTIRRFIREGKLDAVRVGKQYRISDAALGAFVGNSGAELPARAASRQRLITASTTLDINAISNAEGERLVTLLLGAFHSLEGEQNRRRFESIYYAEEGRLRLLINADLELTNAVLGMVRGVLGDAVFD